MSADGAFWMFWAGVFASLSVMFYFSREKWMKRSQEWKRCAAKWENSYVSLRYRMFRTVTGEEDEE